MFCDPFTISLGVRKDRQLTDGGHVHKQCQSMFDRMNLLQVLGGTTWGWHSSYCRQICIAILCSMLRYAAATWTRWQSATSTSKFDKVQLEAAIVITYLVRSTSVEAVLAESKMLTISTCSQTISLLRADESAHLPPADDRRQTLITACRQHLKRKDWRNTKFL